MDMILNEAENGKLAWYDFNRSSEGFFDNLDHTISLEKMKCIDFSDKTIYSFHSYHTNRAFFISLDNEFLGSRDHKPQSSSKIYMRTFIIFTIYIPQAQSDSHAYLYADNNGIFVST